MRVAFDTNIILDALANRENSEVAQKLVTLAAEEKLIGILSANSITDIYYICKKYIGDEKTRFAIRQLFIIFEIGTIDASICEEALRLPMKDFEDAILTVCAHKGKADFIVTRDREFLNSEDTLVKPVTPDELLMQFSN